MRKIKLRIRVNQTLQEAVAGRSKVTFSNNRSAQAGTILENGKRRSGTNLKASAAILRRSIRLRTAKENNAFYIGGKA